MSPAQAAEQGGPTPQPESSSIELNAAELSEILEPATDANLTLTEEAAVEEYLEKDGSEQFDERDLVVGTIENEGAEAVVVAPEEAEPQSVIISANDETGEVSAGGEFALDPDASAVTAGSGFGFPSWGNDSAITVSWVSMQVYHDGDYMGAARFETRSRRDLSGGTDLYQIVRNAVATPATSSATASKVRKLWLSNNLTDETAKNVIEFYLSKVMPQANITECKSGDGGIGPFTVSWHDCSDYDVYLGRPGHYRISYDQGTWAGSGTRNLAYSNAFAVRKGKSKVVTYYQFVTFQKWYISEGSTKCPANGRGPTDDVKNYTCRS